MKKRPKKPLAPRTLERYEGIVRVNITPAIGGVRLAKLDTRVVDRFYGSPLASGGVRGEGLSPRSVHHIHGVLSEALRHARRWGLIARNPCEDAEPPSARQDAPTFTVVDPALARRILQAASGTRLEVMVTLALGTGMRLGEILGVRWQDHDEG